jgi:CubicO group peptidase (beta-lactamase class C family)
MKQAERLQKLLDKTVNGKSIFGATLCVSNMAENTHWQGGAGNLDPLRLHFIASTTKLLTTAVIYQLADEGRLSIDDKLSKHLPQEDLNGLHVFKGKNYSEALTVKHLLAHTSGLPDYFQGKMPSGGSLETELTQGKDRFWDLQEVLRISKTMGAKFAPGTPGKALYSDTNFQLLGKIIALKTASSVGDAYQQRILKPLGMEQSYLYADPNDQKPLHLYFKSQALHIPKAMCSFGPDGGLVSNAAEMMVFLRAFFEGKLFDRKHFEGIDQWNRIFFPLHYGVGIARFKVPWIFSPFKRFPEIIGHSGLSGAFAYYCPAKQLYFTGSVNQIHNPSHSYRMLIQALNLF